MRWFFRGGKGASDINIEISEEILPAEKEEREEVCDRPEGACICPSCPSYSICAQGNGEVLFCIMGMSFRCIREDKGCTCPECPVYPELGLSKKDYCMKGSERDQRWEKVGGSRQFWLLYSSSTRLDIC